MFSDTWSTASMIFFWSSWFPSYLRRTSRGACCRLSPGTLRSCWHKRKTHSDGWRGIILHQLKCFVTTADSLKQCEGETILLTLCYENIPGDIFSPLFKPLQTLRPVFGYVLMSWHINLLYAVFCKRTRFQMHSKRLRFHDAMMVCVGSWDEFVLIIWQGHLCTLNCPALTKPTTNGLYVPSLSCLASSLQKKSSTCCSYLEMQD